MGEPVPWFFRVVWIAALLYAVWVAMLPEKFVADAKRYARPKWLADWFVPPEVARVFAIFLIAICVFALVAGAISTYQRL